jgi:hypothetical protein
MHLKTSGVIAGAAFMLSFILGLIGHAGFPMILIRALVFAILFLILVEAIYMLIDRFLSNIAGNAPESAASPGQRVDISLDDEDTFPAPPADLPEDKGGEANRQNVASSDEKNLDQSEERGYTENIARELASMPSVTDVLSSKVDDLPDMETMSDAFDESEMDESVLSRPVHHSVDKKGSKVGKQFDPAKMAGAIKTLLSQD